VEGDREETSRLLTANPRGGGSCAWTKAEEGGPNAAGNGRVGSGRRKVERRKNAKGRRRDAKGWRPNAAGNGRVGSGRKVERRINAKGWHGGWMQRDGKEEECERRISPSLTGLAAGYEGATG